MDKIDLKKQYRDLYATGAKQRSPHLVEVPPLRYLMIDGTGDPNGSELFGQATGTLYAVSFTLKFAAKETGTDYGVMPLEGLWWANPPEAFAMADRSI